MKAEDPKVSEDCGMCGRPKRSHTETCRACGGPLLHHTASGKLVNPPSVTECWAGRARMAHAKARSAGDWFPHTELIDGKPVTVWRLHATVLDDVEIEAIRRHSERVTLTEHGYQVAP